jgi:hypothetical protein
VSVAAAAADASGAWTGTLKTAERQGRLEANLKQSGQTISGTISLQGEQRQSIENGKVEGAHVTWTLPVGDGIKFDLIIKVIYSMDRLRVAEKCIWSKKAPSRRLRID